MLCTEFGGRPCFQWILSSPRIERVLERTLSWRQCVQVVPFALRRSFCLASLVSISSDCVCDGDIVPMEYTSTSRGRLPLGDARQRVESYSIEDMTSKTG